MDAKIADALQALATGDGTLSAVEGGAAVVMVESADLLQDVLASSLVSADTTVVAAGDTRREAGALHVDGKLWTPARAVRIERDVLVEVHRYTVTQFLSFYGPTVVVMTDDEDLEAFFSDADQALHEGRFARPLMSPAVHLCDLPALHTRGEGGPRRRVVVRADGTCGVSGHGATLGTVRDGLDLLDRRYRLSREGSAAGCPSSLSTSVTNELREQGVARRPWLERYLEVVRAARTVAATGRPVTAVSGFGGRLGPEASGSATQRETGRPVLIRSEESYLLIEPASRRVLRLGAREAALVEALSVGVDPSMSRSLAQLDNALAGRGFAMTGRVAA